MPPPVAICILSAVDHDWAAAALDAMLARVFGELEPPRPMSIIEWAETHRVLSREEANDYAGPYDLDNTPALRGILAECDPKRNRRVVVQKAAQQGYTAGVVCNVIGYHVHWEPCVQVVMFPREKSAKDFDAEKFSPMVRATPALAKCIRLKSRTDGNSTTRKHYPGGLAKFVASNSPSDVKSTSAKIRIVEEPDDTNKDVKGQGNAIALLRERGKTIRDNFELIGGTLPQLNEPFRCGFRQLRQARIDPLYKSLFLALKLFLQVSVFLPDREHLYSVLIGGGRHLAFQLPVFRL